MVWIGLIWLTIGTSGGLLWTRYWTFGFHKMLRSSWVAAKLAAPQDGLSSVSKYLLLHISLVTSTRVCSSSRNLWKRTPRSLQTSMPIAVNKAQRYKPHRMTRSINIMLMLQHVYREFVNTGVASATEPKCAAMQTICKTLSTKPTSHRMETPFQNSEHWNQHDSFSAEFKINKS
jgi:hypothetical protein